MKRIINEPKLRLLEYKRHIAVGSPVVRIFFRCAPQSTNRSSWQEMLEENKYKLMVPGAKRTKEYKEMEKVQKFLGALTVSSRAHSFQYVVSR